MQDINTAKRYRTRASRWLLAHGATLSLRAGKRRNKPTRGVVRLSRAIVRGDERTVRKSIANLSKHHNIKAPRNCAW